MSEISFRQKIAELPLAQSGISLTAVKQESPRPLRILMISAVFRMSYRVMRTVQATGAEIYMLGSEKSKGLRYSRYCRKFVLSSAEIDGSASPEILAEINRCVAEFKIDIVLPADAPSTRSIIGLKDRIAAPCFPLPTLQQFDTLNDKWAFGGMCRELGILSPSSRLFETKEDVLRAIDAGEISCPALAKPLSMDGGNGVIKLEVADARARIEKLSYAPIIIQDFIAGEDIGASVYCEGGVIRSYILHRLKNWTYSTFDDDSVHDALTKLMQHMKVDGVYNFDMRLAKDGRIYYLECNPRFFFKISLSMIAGVNFVRPGLPGGNPTKSSVPAGTCVHLPKAMVMMLATPWRLERRDLSVLGYFYSDPIPYMRESLRIDWT